jgi:hypothetical protein
MNKCSIGASHGAAQSLRALKELAIKALFKKFDSIR